MEWNEWQNALPNCHPATYIGSTSVASGVSTAQIWWQQDGPTELHSQLAKFTHSKRKSQLAGSLAVETTATLSSKSLHQWYRNCTASALANANKELNLPLSLVSSAYISAN